MASAANSEMMDDEDVIDVYEVHFQISLAAARKKEKEKEKKETTLCFRAGHV